MDWTTLFTTVLSAFFGLVSAILVFRLRSEQEKRAHVESQLHEKKIETYFIITDLFLEVIDAIGNEHKMNAVLKKVLPSLQKFRRKVIFLGSDDVLKHFQRYMEGVYRGDEVADQLEKMGLLLAAIRRDMGYPDTEFNPRHFATLILNDAQTPSDEPHILSDLLHKYPDWN